MLSEPQQVYSCDDTKLAEEASEDNFFLPDLRQVPGLQQDMMRYWELRQDRSQQLPALTPWLRASVAEWLVLKSLSPGLGISSTDLLLSSCVSLSKLLSLRVSSSVSASAFSSDTPVSESEESLTTSSRSTSLSLPSWVVRLLNCVPEVVARADRKMQSSVVK